MFLGALILDGLFDRFPNIRGGAIEGGGAIEEGASFEGKPLGWMIEQAGAELFVFSTDFPHPEGGRDPLAKFEAEMDSIDDRARHRFFYDNMAELLGPSLVPSPATP